MGVWVFDVWVYGIWVTIWGICTIDSEYNTPKIKVRMEVRMEKEGRPQL